MADVFNQSFFSVTPNQYGMVSGSSTDGGNTTFPWDLADNTTYTFYFCTPSTATSVGWERSDWFDDNFIWTQALQTTTFVYNTRTYKVYKITLTTLDKSSDQTGKWIRGKGQASGTTYPATFCFTIRASTVRTLTFNSNGGAEDFGWRPILNNSTYQSSFGRALPTPTRSGYTFNGWYSAASGGTQFTSSTAVTSTRTVYAQWVEPYYEVSVSVPSTYSGASVTITYDGTSSTVNSGNSLDINVSPGSSIRLTATNISGYVFKRWCIEDWAAEELWYDPGTGTNHTFEYSNIAGDLGISPEYTPIYTVTIQSNNTSYGTVSPTSVTQVPSGTTISVSSNQLTINGTTVTATPRASTSQYVYGFVNWAGIPSNNKVTSNLTITANFARTAQEYTVSFNPNGGTFPYTNTIVSGITYGSTTSSIATKPVYYGDIYGTLPTPSKANHTFQGWYTATTGGTRVTSSSTVALSDDQPLYARFTLITYTVTFEPNNTAYGKVNNQSQVVQDVPQGTTYSTSNNVFTLNTSPTTTVTATPNAGYTFDYWGTDTGSPILSNMTATAYFVRANAMGSAAVPLESVSTTLDTIHNGHYTDIYVFNGSTVSIGSSGDGETYSIDIYNVPSGYGLSNNYGSLGGTLTAIGDITVTYTYTEVDEDDVYLTFTIHSIQGYNATLVLPSYIGYSASLSAPGYTSVSIAYGNTGSLKVVSGTVVTYSISGSAQRFQFTGWKESQSAQTYVSTDTSYAKTVTQDYTLYATFQALYQLKILCPIYTEAGAILYNGEPIDFEGIGEPYVTYMLPYQTQFELEFVPATYNLSYWREYVEGLEEEIYYDNPDNPGTFTMYADDVRIEAMLENYTVTVTFDATTNGGTLVGVSSKTVTYGETFGEDGVWPTAIKSGHVFDGWYTLPVGGSLKTASTEVDFTYNRTLYAQFSVSGGGSDDPPNPDAHIETVGDVSGGSTTGQRCYLAYYKENNVAPTAVLYLPNVQGIEETDTAQLTEISTVIYGYDDNFVMDIGTIQKYNITFTRVQPTNWVKRYDTEAQYQSFDHQDKWSNGHWFEMFKKFTERWQNLNYGVVDNAAVRTGGYRFHFEPGTESFRPGVSYSDLYPVLDKTVFILGTASMQMSPNNLQYIRVSLPVTVGSMVRQVVTTPGHEVRYMVNQGNLHLTNIVRYPSNLPFPVVAPPKSWFLEGALGLAEFKSWTSDPPIGGVSTWYPGQIVGDTTNAVSSMTAYWNIPLLTVMVTYDMTTDGTLVWDASNPLPDANNPSRTYALSEISSASTIRAWAIGGGGSGGSGGGAGGGGGGGGSGGYDTCSMGFHNANLTSITFTVGRRGAYPTRDGGSSSLTLNYTSSDLEILSVSGGLVGKSGDMGGSGGKGGSPGGTSGGSAQESTGGQGGGVPGLENGLRLGDFTLVSVGGAGGGMMAHGSAGQGYGAGGGGGGIGPSLYSGGEGTAGVIILAFYE